MLTLWGRLSSINVQKATWAIEELALPYRRIDAGGAFGLNDTPEYLAKNPTGLVPTLEQDGLVLWESNAIVRYLAARYGAGTLWPEDPTLRAKSDLWMDWQTTAFAPAMRNLFWQLIRTPKAEQDSTLIASSLAASERMAAILDRHLADRSYVAGEAFTMGDIAAAPAVHRWLNLSPDRQPRPNLDRYYAAMMARPAASRVLGLPLT